MTQKASVLESKLLQTRGKKSTLSISPSPQIHEEEENKLAFDLTSDQLFYRQEVIAQTLGGLNVFQVTITKRPNAGGLSNNQK
jgi:hypothetical protein